MYTITINQDGLPIDWIAPLSNPKGIDLLLTVLNFHITLDGADLSPAPTELLEEIHTRLRNLRELVDQKFKEADRELRKR